MWQLLTISPGNMAKFAKKISKRPMLHLNFFFIITMQNSPKTNHWQWPSQILKYPTPLLVPPKTPPWDMVHICHFTIFEPTKQKLFNLKWFSSLWNFKNLTLIFSQINLAKFHMNFGVKPLIVLRQKVLSFNDIHALITNYLSSVIVALKF
jgi:hypothetical protein